MPHDNSMFILIFQPFSLISCRNLRHLFSCRLMVLLLQFTIILAPLSNRISHWLTSLANAFTTWKYETHSQFSFSRLTHGNQNSCSLSLTSTPAFCELFVRYRKDFSLPSMVEPWRRQASLRYSSGLSGSLTSLPVSSTAVMPCGVPRMIRNRIFRHRCCRIRHRHHHSSPLRRELPTLLYQVHMLQFQSWRDAAVH